MNSVLNSIAAALLLSGCTAAPVQARGADYDDPSNGTAPYSRSVLLGDTLYLSGVLGTRDGKLAAGGIQAQTTAAFENIQRGLAKRGLGLADLVKCTVFLADIGDFAAMNEVYKRTLNAPRPARTTVGSSLVFGAAIEVDCIADATTRSLDGA